ncbi:hypothetical protein CJ014_00840 [Pleomorphomonas carboxyditropha]|uniref:Uncharacterized protein n=1 Tax=Pleomorphomonas carboxyditropha TaxID=2023338 RepID=A0A2G9X2A4_9HYPH|nr:hypothetical protein CJ014_00840 [Pleomorphomonas carboxyditropha]
MARIADTALSLEPRYPDVFDWPIYRVIAAAETVQEDRRNEIRGQAVAVSVGFSGDKKAFEGI